MAGKVTNTNEIFLGTDLFPIRGGVRPSLISVMPGKVVMGDYSLADDMVASTWGINDQRGGILVEEMDEAIHLDKCWWSTADLRHRGHMTLPPLATDCGAGGLTSKDAYFIKDYASAVYAAFDDKLRVWNETDGDFEDEVDHQIEDCEDTWDEYNNPNITMATSTDKQEGTNSVKITVDSATVGEMLALETISSADLTSATKIKFDIKSSLAAASGELQLHLNSGRTWTSPTAFTDNDGWTDEAKAYDESTTTKAVNANVAQASWTEYLDLEHSAINCDRVRFWAHSETEHASDEINIQAYYGGAWHAVYEGTYTHGEWVTKYIPAGTQSVTKFQVKIYNGQPAAAKDLYLHELDFGEVTTETIDITTLAGATWTELDLTITTPANLGSVTSIGIKSIADLGAEPYDIYIDDVRIHQLDLPANPTSDAIVYQVSGTDKLFIPCGDNYVIYDGSTQVTDTDDAEHFVEWDAKLFKIDSTGQLAYSTNGTSWTNNGKLKLPDDSCLGLFIYRDADADEIIYARTKVGLYAHDYTNAKFIETELALPNHPTAGKGGTRWRDASYISAGLAVYKYIAASTATISYVGLTEDDGLPSDYRGEITQLIKGHHEMHALVDSTYVTGTQYSSVMAYDGGGWQCRWLSATADKAIKCALISSTHAYYLWFGTNNGVYRIPLRRDIENPKKISGYTYGASAVHISPWFDAGWIGEKLALSIKLFCKDTTADETVIVKYRIDHTYGDIDTGWTTLGTIKAEDEGDEVEYLFGSDEGIVFKAIQFRFDLAQGAVTTLSPDIQYIKLKYLKLLDTKWGWTTTIDCSQADKVGKSPSQLDALLKEVVSTQTLVDFSFRDEMGDDHNHKVRVANCQGIERTGADWRNQWLISLVAP